MQQKQHSYCLHYLNVTTQGSNLLKSRYKKHPSF